MAGNYEKARAFVDDLSVRGRDPFAADTRELLEFARQDSGDPAFELCSWDLGYYSEKLRKARFDFDEEELRPYFPLDTVIDGLFETASRLYGVRVAQNRELPVWHEEVRAFDLFDGELHIASFYMDLHPREEKRGGAWMNNLHTGIDAERRATTHSGLICANITRPSGGKPALLTHGEVETMFHEFGHLLHHCLTKVSVRSLAGTNVAWDFVELPSQIMENWCWEREALDTFARHYETKERIPEPLFDKMNRARTFREASAMMRQLGFATVDLSIHVEYDAERDGPLLPYAKKLTQPFSPAPLPEGYAMLASFSHLFSGAVGYAAGYYSYKWAEVLDADAFTRFKSAGIFDRETGLSFRTKILEKGDSADPMNLYRDFMGREPKLDALLERAGLTNAAPA
jgi:oligopeptidase A